jgi:hypothetical protein
MVLLLYLIRVFLRLPNPNNPTMPGLIGL